MSEGRSTKSLASMVHIDPESLPQGTLGDYSFRYIDINAVAGGRVRLPDEDTQYRTAPSRARRVIRDGDVIMSTVRPNLKAFAYCELPNGNHVASTGFAVLRAVDGNDPRYILYSILSDPVSQQIGRFEVGSNYPAINASDLKRLQIAAFDPPAQRRISSILSTVGEAIERTEALIAKYQQIKAGMMHDLFTRGVTPDGRLRPFRSEALDLYKESSLGWIPKEWRAEFLDTLAHRGSGHTPNKNHPEYWNGGVKWVSLADSWRLDRVYISETDYEISELGISNSSAVLHPPGIVVLSRDAGVGKSAITTCHMAVSQHFMSWQCGPRLDKHYLYYWLQSHKREFENIATGSTIPTIGLRFFKLYRIAVPIDVSEQKKIGSMLLAVDQTILALEENLRKLRGQKSGLMHDLLTGRVRVNLEEAATT